MFLFRKLHHSKTAGAVLWTVCLCQMFVATDLERGADLGDQGQQPDAGTVNLCSFAIKPCGAGTWLTFSRF